MSANPPSPATSELQAEMTVAELEELFNRTKTVLEDEENYNLLTICENIQLSWPSISKMEGSLREVSNGTLEDLIKKYPEEEAVTLWTAIIASRSYKLMSAILEERTALLQSVRSPEGYMQVLESQGICEEERLEAQSIVQSFFQEVDNYKGPLSQTLREVTRTVDMYKKKVQLIFRESVNILKDPVFWEERKFFMQSADLADLATAKRGFSIRDLSALDPDLIQNLEVLSSDARGEVQRVSILPREFLTVQEPRDIPHVQGGPGGGAKGKEGDAKSGASSISTLSPQQQRMKAKLLKRLVEGKAQVELLQGKPVSGSQGEVCTKMSEAFEKEMERLQKLPLLESSPAEREELDDMYGDIEDCMEELQALAQLVLPEERVRQSGNYGSGSQKPSNSFLKVAPVKARRLTATSTDYLGWREETRKLLTVINYSPTQSVFFVYDSCIEKALSDQFRSEYSDQINVVEDVFKILDDQFINPSRDFDSFAEKLSNLPKCTDESYEETVLLITFLKSKFASTTNDTLSSAIWNYSNYSKFTAKLPPFLEREVFALVVGNANQSCGTPAEWDPVLKHLMNQLTFLRNRPNYNVERFIELKAIHEKGKKMTVGMAKVSQEKKFVSEKPKHSNGVSKPVRVHANVAVAQAVRPPPVCHICSQAHYWRKCDILTDPTKIASVAQTLTDKKFCLKCVRPLGVCKNTCTGQFKLKNGAMMSTVCRDCTDPSRHWQICMCRGEKTGVLVCSSVVSSQGKTAGSSGIGSTKMLTEMIEFTTPGSDKTVTRMVMYDSGCGDSLMNQNTMVKHSHDFKLFNDVTMFAFNQSRSRNSMMLQHTLYAKHHDTLTEIKGLAVPSIPRVVSDTVKIPEIWMNRLNVQEINSEGKECDLLIGLDMGDLQPLFRSHISFKGEILSLWISQLTGSYLIGGKSASNLSFVRKGVGVNLVQDLSHLPPLFEGPPAPLTDKEGTGTGESDREQKGLDSKQTESLVEMVCLDNCVEKDTIVGEVKIDLDHDLRADVGRSPSDLPVVQPALVDLDLVSVKLNSEQEENPSGDVWLIVTLT